MTLADLMFELNEQGHQPSDNNDYELLMMDGLPVTGIIVEGNRIYLSDEEIEPGIVA